MVADSAARILDEYLVAAARTGDRHAFGLLARRWHGKLVAHAWRLTGDPDMAQDAAQASWLEIVGGLGRLRDEKAFPAWAYRIVTRRCARQLDQRIRGRRLAQSLAENPPEQPAPVDAALVGSALRSAIAALPPDQRGAIALFYLEELSVAEVAVALHVPVGTVKTRLMHARRKLRGVLEGEE
ncbi:MAG TPA: RNA polymerase sigma factor [Sphingomicrobium sp.]|nr:RNA polymerase sigma factor [Sphingomicrobium sp.]